MAQKRPRSPSPDPSTNIFRSSPILDRSSKFIAIYSPTISHKQLRDQYEITSAIHRMAAWRKPSSQRALTPQQRLFDSGHDDDGEQYGGKTLGSVLASLDVEGSIVVARWFGGVMLGPVRFDHIRNCAQEAIDNWKAEQKTSAKRIKVKEDADRKASLIEILPERDRSITVLRELLAEKKGTSSNEDRGKSSPAKVPDYSKLPLLTLKKLEQVRDATLAWILKEIEKAESMEQLASNAHKAPYKTSKSPKGAAEDSHLRESSTIEPGTDPSMT